MSGSDSASRKAFPLRRLRRLMRSTMAAARNYVNPGSNLSAELRREVSLLQLSDLAGRTPYSLAVLANACIAVWAFGRREDMPSWRIELWTAGLVAVLISYVF